MVKKQKKKRRIGLTVFLIVLALIILIPVGLYIYLRAEHFPVSKMQAAHPYAETYSGYRSYENGQVFLQLDEAELYWLAESYGLSDLEVPMLTINGYAVELEDDFAQLYADLTFASFLPIPVYAKISFSEAVDGVIPINIEEAKLGKWLPVPLELLNKFDVDLNLSLDLNESIDGYHITDVSLSDGLLHASVALKASYAQGIEPDQTADILFMYGAEKNTFLSAASTIYQTRNSHIFEQIAAAEDAAQFVTHLLSLSPKEPEIAYLEKLTAVDRRYILPISIDEVKQQRADYENEIAHNNRNLQILLDNVRDAYRTLEIFLDSDGYQNVSTGEPLSISAFAPELGLADNDLRLLLLTATDPMKKPASAEMPPLSRVPRESDQVPANSMKNVPYDIGVILPMPSGDYAMLYYLSSGEMVIHCIPDAMTEEMLVSYAVPEIFNLDNAVFGIIRSVKKAPAADLTDYIVFLPDAVESAYQARN